MSIATQPQRLVVTLSTIPSRIGKIGPVLDSLKAQSRKPDRIYVCICNFCEWEQKTYDVPKRLQEDESIRVVVSPIDYGPANKLLGMLHEESAPNTRIVTVDDDWLYNRDLLERLEDGGDRYPGSAVGLSGATLLPKWSRIDVRIGHDIETAAPTRRALTFVAEPSEDVCVDILQFGFGAMLLREWFDDDIYEMIQPEQPLFFSDDILFSGFLESRGVKRMCVSGISLPQLLDHSQLRPLSGEGRMTRNYKVAIPTISDMLGIWHHGAAKFDLRNMPTLSDLRYSFFAMVRKIYRILQRALSSITWH